MTDLPTYVMDRTFEAPPELVWKTWTTKEHLSRWYGPNVETIVHALDVRPGGQWLVEMKSDKWSSFQRADYTEVDPARRLVFLMSMADENWQIAPNPQVPDWPRVLHTEVTFEPVGGRTRLRLVWTPQDATDAEIACFAGAMKGMGRGWSAGMDLLEEILAEMQAA